MRGKETKISSIVRFVELSVPYQIIKIIQLILSQVTRNRWEEILIEESLSKFKMLNGELAS